MHFDRVNEAQRRWCWTTMTNIPTSIIYFTPIRKDFQFHTDIGLSKFKLILFSNQTDWNKFPNEMGTMHTSHKKVLCCMCVRERVHLLQNILLTGTRAKDQQPLKQKIIYDWKVQPFCFFICGKLCGPCEKTLTVQRIDLSFKCFFFVGFYLYRKVSQFFAQSIHQFDPEFGVWYEVRFGFPFHSYHLSVEMASHLHISRFKYWDKFPFSCLQMHGTKVAIEY